MKLQMRDRFWWLWLLAGATLLAIGTMQTVVPLASWLAPVFLLRAVRTQRAIIVLPALAIASYLACLVAIRDFWPTPGLYTFALAGVGIVIVFAADKALASRLSGIPRTLVFPLADTSFGFLFSSGQFATMGHTAYTQVDNLALLQLASVTGIWAISFLMNWFASVVNELWEHGFDLRANRRAVALYAGVMAVVLLTGGIRLAFFAPSSPTVRVAGLEPDRELNDAYVAAGIRPGPRTAAERAALRAQVMDPLFKDFFNRTREAAQGGAKIVVWSEASGFMFKEDERDLVQQAQAVAREANVYLQMTPVFVLPRTEFPFVEIRAILIDPQGDIVWDYPKAKSPFGDGNAPGPGTLPVVDTPYGRLSTAICFDADFPALMQQAGRAGVDILLLPVSDWEAVAEMHARMAVPRAVENGMAVVRPARQGISLAVDQQGRLLSYKPDYFTGDDHTMIVNVPVQGTSTVYAVMGDSFAYLSIAGFVLLTAATLLQNRLAPRARRRAGVTVSGLSQRSGDIP